MNLLLESSIRAASIAVAAAAVVRGLRISSAPARHLAWSAVLAAMLLLPALSMWTPKLTVRLLPATIEKSAGDLQAPAPYEILAPASPAASSPLRPVEQPTGPLPWRPDLLLAAYLFGAGVLLLRLFLGTARAVSLRRHSTPEAGFRSSAACGCPVTMGWSRPTVILPTSWKQWPAAELDAVLAHERAHARRRDPLVQWLAALNRSIFWFHPLAWWLEHRLAALAEEACDAAAVAGGHDPRDYSEYLLHQARELNRAGARIALPGPAMGRGLLAKRIRLLLDGRPAPALSRPRAIAGTALCAGAIALFGACQLGRVEKAAAGQPTMNELMHRRAQSNQQEMDKSKALLDRARTLTPAEAQTLLAKVKENAEDQDAYWTLVRHYEHTGNVHDLDALRLWLIEHKPDGKLWPGNINPQFDRPGYERGKALWLAHLKRPGAAPDIYQRAADFLEGADRPLAEAALHAGQKAYPDDTRWAQAFGRHYAQALLGSGEPVTEYNVFRTASAREAQSSYAQAVRAHLAESKDVRVLAQTAQWLTAWGHKPETSHAAELARTYADQALGIDPNSALARSVKMRVGTNEQYTRVTQLKKMTPAELAAISEGDRILLALSVMREAWIRQKPDDATAKARELLAMVAAHQNDPLYGQSRFEANIVLGKAALRNGDRKAAVGYLQAAADAPVSDLRQGHFDMNLPRALVDWGERRAVAEYLERIAPKTDRPQQTQDWAAQIRKGLNPDLIPTFSSPGCSKGPC